LDGPGSLQVGRKQFIPVTYPEAAVLAHYEQGREGKNEAQVTVRVIVDDQLVE